MTGSQSAINDQESAMASRVTTLVRMAGALAELDAKKAL
jgi:hypothetical protein